MTSITHQAHVDKPAEECSIFNVHVLLQNSRTAASPNSKMCQLDSTVALCIFCWCQEQEARKHTLTYLLTYSNVFQHRNPGKLQGNAVKPNTVAQTMRCTVPYIASTGESDTDVESAS
jgi:hypothetical protein